MNLFSISAQNGFQLSSSDDNQRGGNNKVTRPVKIQPENKVQLLLHDNGFFNNTDKDGTVIWIFVKPFAFLAIGKNIFYTIIIWFEN